MSLPPRGPAWCWKAAPTPFKQHLAAMVSQQQPQHLSSWVQLPFVLPAWHGLVLSRSWQRARQCPSEPIYFYEQPSCLFSWGKGLHFAPGCCLGMRWVLLQASTSQESFSSCSAHAQRLHVGGLLGLGRVPSPAGIRDGIPSVACCLPRHGLLSTAGESKWEFCPRRGISWDAAWSTSPR